MIELKAIIRPNKLSALRLMLLETPDFPGMTVTRVEGCSPPAKTMKVNIKEELTDYSAKIRIEIVCNDEIAEILMEKIVAVCKTGQVGDGVVWYTNVPKAYFISKST